MIEGEENLITEAKQGSAASFGKLYDHYIAPIYRFIYMKVTNRHEAEDLTHEVFLSAWQNLYRYRPQGFPFSSWLYQIARNRVIDHYRLRKNNVSIEGLDVDIVSAVSSVEHTLDDDLSLRHVRSAMQRLNHDQQDVVLMKFMQDLSHGEIAKIMGRSEGAVRLIQHRAISELKRLLNANLNEAQPL